MNVINQFRLRDFWTEHQRSETALRAWHQLVSSHDWESPEALRTTFPYLTEHGSLAVFDLSGSTYFLITTIDEQRKRIYVRDLMLHSDFRTEAWKSLAEPDETPVESAYTGLVSRFELRPIRDDGALREAGSIIDQLLKRPGRSQDEQDYLDVLTLIVADYEAQHVPVPPVSGAEIVRLLVMEHRLSQVELIPLLGGKEKTSALLRGKRPLDLRQATRASRYFKLPADVFMDPDNLEDEQ